MKEVITIDVVREIASKKQGPIRLTPNTIITPAARDQAQALGIEIIEQDTASRDGRPYSREQIIGTVVQFLKEEFGDKPLDEDTVRTVVMRVLKRLG